MSTTHTPESVVRGFQAAADYLKVSLATAKRLAKAGKLGGQKLSTRRIVFATSDLDRVAATRGGVVRVEMVEMGDEI